MIDFLRLAVMGSRLPWSIQAHEVVEDLGGKEECTVIGHPNITNSPNAAFLNGVFSHGLEWDDIHSPAILHPGVVVFPTALAMGEKFNINGETFITACVAGYEAMVRIGLVVQPSHFVDRGFHATASVGVFGSVVTAGKILNFDSEKMSHAIGLAASYASGLAEFFLQGSTIKRIHAGKAAHSGILSALLAKSGITAPYNILETDLGFFKGYSDSYDSNKLIENLGKNLKIMEIAVKSHGSGRHLQSPLDGVISLVTKHNIKIDSVEEIRVGTAQITIDRLFDYEPNDVMERQLSIPYAIGIVLSKGAKDYLEFRDFEKNIENEEFFSLVNKVKPVVDMEMAEFAPQGHVSRITIKLKDQKEFTEAIINPKGNPENPFTTDELEKRFRKHTTTFLSEDKKDLILTNVSKLENIKNINELTYDLRVK